MEARANNLVGTSGGEYLHDNETEPAGRIFLDGRPGGAPDQAFQGNHAQRRQEGQSFRGGAYQQVLAGPARSVAGESHRRHPLGLGRRQDVEEVGR